MHLDGVETIVYRFEIYYKKSLKKGDKFSFQLIVERYGNLKFIFNQQIFKNNDVLMLKAILIVLFSKNGKPIVPPKNVIDAF